MPRAYDAILLITFGGPTRREEISPFLDVVLKGRPTPKERVEEVVHHYEAIGGASPINAITERQAEALRRELDRSGSGDPSHTRVPVYVGMRNWHPTILFTLSQMMRDECERILAVILAPHRSPVSCQLI